MDDQRDPVEPSLEERVALIEALIAGGGVIGLLGLGGQGGAGGSAGPGGAGGGGGGAAGGGGGSGGAIGTSHVVINVKRIYATSAFIALVVGVAAGIIANHLS